MLTLSGDVSRQFVFLKCQHLNTATDLKCPVPPTVPPEPCVDECFLKCIVEDKMCCFDGHTQISETGGNHFVFIIDSKQNELTPRQTEKITAAKQTRQTNGAGLKHLLCKNCGSL